jgi:hypothetical protein
MDKVQIEILEGWAGLCLSIDNTRVCGAKSGQYQTVKSWKVSVKDLKEIIERVEARV